MKLKIPGLCFVLILCTVCYPKGTYTDDINLKPVQQTSIAGLVKNTGGSGFPKNVPENNVTGKMQDCVAMHPAIHEIYRTELQLKNTQLNTLTLLSLLMLIITLVIYRSFKKAAEEKKMTERLKNSIHHDVKNQYQEILAFLRLTKNEGKTFSLQDASARISSMAKVHEMLYNADAAAGLSLQACLLNICYEVRNIFGNRNIDVHVYTPVTLPNNKAGKIGLIVNELMVNICKYAFELAQKGYVEISLIKNGHHYFLSVADNGKGIVNDKKAIKGFGSALIAGWADELDGTFEIKNNNGTRFEMKF